MTLVLFPGLPAADRGQRWRSGRASWTTRADVFDPGRYTVTAIADDNTAAAFVQAHHYAGTYPAARLRYGLVDDHTGELAGVAVVSVPMQAKVLTAVFPDLEPYVESLELGRFVLLDSVGFNGETWFLRRARRLAAAVGVRGLVSFSDPVARTTATGQTVFPGHIGGIYQASSAAYCGRGTARSLCLLRDGTVLSARALSKVRQDERGREYVTRLLVAHGARPPRGRQKPAVWLREALDDAGVRRVRHPGNHRYAFRLGTPAERRRIRLGLSAEPYPKRSTAA